MKEENPNHPIQPHYTKAEEVVNTSSHGLGILMGILVLLSCIQKSESHNHTPAVLSSIVYGISMIILYTASTCYHALSPSPMKQIFRILDHCTIYLLIAGTYTPIIVICFLPNEPWIGYALLAIQWGVSTVAIILNAIDMRRFRVFSYTAYIILGWCILFFGPTAIRLISMEGFLYLLLGGISYTIGAILFAIGSKKPWFHSVFHIFVLLGSYLQFLAIFHFIL